MRHRVALKAVKVGPAVGLTFANIFKQVTHPTAAQPARVVLKHFMRIARGVRAVLPLRGLSMLSSQWTSRIAMNAALRKKAVDTNGKKGEAFPDKLGLIPSQQRTTEPTAHARNMHVAPALL